MQKATNACYMTWRVSATAAPLKGREIQQHVIEQNTKRTVMDQQKKNVRCHGVSNVHCALHNVAKKADERGRGRV